MFYPYRIFFFFLLHLYIHFARILYENSCVETDDSEFWDGDFVVLANENIR